jgi:hypothetical protein
MSPWWWPIQIRMHRFTTRYLQLVCVQWVMVFLWFCMSVTCFDHVLLSSGSSDLNRKHTTYINLSPSCTCAILTGCAKSFSPSSWTLMFSRNTYWGENCNHYSFKLHTTGPMTTGVTFLNPFRWGVLAKVRKHQLPAAWHVTLSTCNLLKTVPVCCDFLLCRPWWCCSGAVLGLTVQHTLLGQM